MKKSRFDKLTAGRINSFFLILVFLASFGGGYFLGFEGYRAEIQRNPPKIEIVRPKRAERADFSLLFDVLDLVQKKYLRRGEISREKLLYGAIGGLAEALEDPYTTFLTPKENESLKAALRGEYEGIGAEIGTKEEKLLIIAPLNGSPAKRAGVQAGDQILAINGEETKNMSLTEAVMKIRGKAGTKVELRIKNQESRIKDVEIVREKIILESVKWEKKDNVAYIRLSRFTERTNGEWREMAREIQAFGPQGIILDVGDNPGGFLDAAVYVASEFVKKGTPVVTEEFGTGQQKILRAGREGKFKDMPLVVLINKGSASASEILAGALREKAGATLVGEGTFGKGTVQEAKDLQEGAGIHLTVARWLLPSGKCLEGQGLKPDYEIEEEKKQMKKAFELLSH